MLNENEIIKNENRKIVSIGSVPVREEEFRLEEIDGVILLNLENQLYTPISGFERRYGLKTNTVYIPTNNCLKEEVLDPIEDFFKPSQNKWKKEANKVGYPVGVFPPVFVKLSAIEIAITQMKDLKNGKMPYIKEQVLKHLKSLSERHMLSQMTPTDRAVNDVRKLDLIAENKEARAKFLKIKAKTAEDEIEQSYVKAVGLPKTAKCLALKLKEKDEFVDLKRRQLLDIALGKYLNLNGEVDERRSIE